MMKLLGVFTLVLSMTACGGDSGSGSSGSDAVFGKATEALTSISDAVESAAFTTVSCENGDPTSSAPGDANYAGEHVYCSLNTNSKSPDTIQGSYFIVAAVLCAVEKKVSFNFDSAPTNHDGVIFDEDDSCFGDDGFNANGDDNVNGTVLISLQDQSLTGSDYDNVIGIQLGELTYDDSRDPDVSFYLKDSDGVLAARVYQEGMGSIMEFVINSAEGVFYYENRDYENNRHIRLAAEGSLSSSGSFNNVDSAKYIYGQGEAVSGRSVMMNFDSGASLEEYDHHINNVRDADYTAISSIPYIADFHTWVGRGVTDHDPVADSILDLSTFNMSF